MYLSLDELTTEISWYLMSQPHLMLIFIFNKHTNASNDFHSITTDRIDLYDVLSEDRRNVHLQFLVRGTSHPSTGSFNGYNPEYKVEVLETFSSSVVWGKTYKDTSHHIKIGQYLMYQ